MIASTPARLILVLQSDPAHGRLIQALLRDHETPPLVVAIADDQDALAFLRQQGRHATAPRPDLILLDLDWPEATDGYGLLSTIKSDPNLRRIPTIVLTVSQQADDIFQSYLLQGNCYVIRPGDRDQLQRVIRSIESFWLQIVTLPLE